jgi:hypothetical protein
MCSLPPPINPESTGISGRNSIAKFLRESGYTTGGFHSNPFLSEEFGYGEYFNHFHDGSIGTISHSQVQNSLRNAGRLLLFNKGPVADGKDIVGSANAWLRTQRGRVFLWVHLMDTHFPYLPWTSLTGPVESMTNRLLWLYLMSRRIQYLKGRPSSQTIVRVKHAYQKSAFVADYYCSLLFSCLAKHFDDTFLIVCSDHGEAFWEHERFGHTGIYDEILRVPMIVYGRNLPRGRVVRDTALLADIFPTIQDLLGNEGEFAIGRSLLSLFDGERWGTERDFVCGSMDPPFGRRMVGARSSRFKYVRNEDLRGNTLSEEAYDLTEDPLEKRSIPEKKSELRGWADSLMAKAGYGVKETIPGFTRDEDFELSERLRSLGYL